MVDDPAPLTRRQRQILQLAASGLPYQQVADELYLHIGTVRRHLVAAKNRLKATNMLHAVALATQRGLIRVPDRIDE